MIKTATVIQAAVFLTSALFVGCASIMNGTKEQIGFSSSPSGAVVSVGNAESGECFTPCILNLPRSGYYNVSIEKEGYHPAGATIVQSRSHWLWGNFYTIVPIGLAIDFISGAAYELTPQTININLQKK